MVFKKKTAGVVWGTAAMLFMLFIAVATLKYTKPASMAKSKIPQIYSILICIDEKKIYLLKSGRPFKSYACAVGKQETPSPVGFYKIVDKQHWGEGFGGYWIGINCPWGHYGMHGTTRPDTIGQAASHGCFRMRNRDVKELYSIVPLSTPVLITGGCYGPFGSYFRILGPGTYGADVQAVQKRMREMGIYSGNCNGRFDAPGFKEAVHRYKLKNGLGESYTVDKQMLAQLGFSLSD